MNPLCPLCDVRMRTLDGKLVCPLCGHSRPAHGHKIGLCGALLGAALALPACGGIVADPPADPAAPQPAADTTLSDFAVALCAYEEPMPRSVHAFFGLPPGATHEECLATVARDVAGVPSADFPCVAEFTAALEANAPADDMPRCEIRLAP